MKRTNNHDIVSSFVKSTEMIRERRVSLHIKLKVLRESDESTRDTKRYTGKVVHGRRRGLSKILQNCSLINFQNSFYELLVLK